MPSSVLAMLRTSVLPKPVDPCEPLRVNPSGELANGDSDGDSDSDSELVRPLSASPNPNDFLHLIRGLRNATRIELLVTRGKSCKRTPLHLLRAHTATPRTRTIQKDKRANHSRSATGTTRSRNPTSYGTHRVRKPPSAHAQPEPKAFGGARLRVSNRARMA